MDGANSSQEKERPASLTRLLIQPNSFVKTSSFEQLAMASGVSIHPGFDCGLSLGLKLGDFNLYVSIDLKTLS